MCCVVSSIAHGVLWVHTERVWTERLQLGQCESRSNTAHLSNCYVFNSGCSWLKIHSIFVLSKNYGVVQENKTWFWPVAQMTLWPQKEYTTLIFFPKFGRTKTRGKIKLRRFLDVFWPVESKSEGHLAPKKSLRLLCKLSILRVHNCSEVRLISTAETTFWSNQISVRKGHISSV